MDIHIIYMAVRILQWSHVHASNAIILSILTAVEVVTLSILQIGGISTLMIILFKN
jgi:hypothetical protein